MKNKVVHKPSRKKAPPLKTELKRVKEEGMGPPGKTKKNSGGGGNQHGELKQTIRSGQKREKGKKKDKRESAPDKNITTRIKTDKGTPKRKIENELG